MKKYFFLVILILIVSCEKKFHKEEDDYIVIDNEQETIDILNGIYANLVKAYNSDYFEALCRSDDINIYYNYSFSWPQFQQGCGLSRTFDRTPNYDNIYLRFYRIIISANSVIPQISEEKEPGLLGELYLLRAYSYYTLARFFGNPYLVKDIEVNYLLERPSYNEVYEYIEEDMLTAIRLLPDTYTNARIQGETPHKGTAKALLAEIYLTWAGYPVNDQSKYNKAAQYASEVIQNDNYYGFGLDADFANLWQFRNKENKENVFGIFLNSKYDEIIIASRNKPEFKFYNTMPSNYRKNSSFITGKNLPQEVWTPDSIYYYDKYVTFNPLTNPCQYLNYVFQLKWINPDIIKKSAVNGDFRTEVSEITLYLLRYAQTLLTFAEARACSGIFDDSTYEAVNMIRRRANKLDPKIPSEFDLNQNLSMEQFLDSLVWERAWELCFEPNGRWFDIVRLDLKDKLPGYRYEFDFPYEVPQEFLQDNWYFYQLPE